MKEHGGRIPAVIFFFSIVFVVGCRAPLTTPIAPSSPMAHPSPDANQPVLYPTLEGPEGQRHPQMNAISKVGSRISLSMPGLGATWSPDGRQIAYVAGYTELRLTNTSGETKTIFATDGTKELILDRPMWSPDGKSIAIILLPQPRQGPYVNSLAVIDVTQQKVLYRYPFSTDVIHLPVLTSPPDKFRWSPDGRKVLISWDSAVIIYVDTGRVEPIGRTHVIAEWAPTSNAVYYFEVTGTEGGVPEPNISLGGLYVKSLGATSVKLMEKASLAATGIGLSAPMYGLMTLSPHGTKLALSTGSTKGGGDIMRVYDLRTGLLSIGNPVKVVETEEKILALDWAPDEQSLGVISASDKGIKVKVFNLASDEWKVLAVWQLLEGMEIDVFALKALSWTQ